MALLDTNCDPTQVDIPIPANDDAIRSIKLIVGKLADAIYEGRHGQLEEPEADLADEDDNGMTTSDDGDAEALDIPDDSDA